MIQVLWSETLSLQRDYRASRSVFLDARWNFIKIRLHTRWVQ